MTDMKRVTIAFPDEIDAAVLQLKRTENLRRCSYSEIIRRLVAHGLEVMEQSAEKPQETV